VNATAERRVRELSPAVVAEVRQSVRSVLENAEVFAAASEKKKKELAKGLVDLGLIAAGLMNDERKSDEKVKKRSKAVAAALSAGDQLGMQATKAAAGTLTGLRDAIDFPNYVGSLITGVFQAILNSSATQLGTLSDMVESVGVSAEDYASSVDDSEVARWLVGKFPRLLRPNEDGSGVDAAAGVDLQEHAAELQKVLGSEADGSDVDVLLESARRKMAQDKQTTLATMMQMGLQRIVVDEGRIHASMDLRVDAQSASAEAKAQRDDWRFNAGASGGFGNGIWSAQASASTSIGQVKSDAQMTNEQIGVRAGLRSSVDLAFRTDQVPLDRVASRSARVHLDNAARAVDVGGDKSILTPTPANFAAPSLDTSPQQGTQPSGQSQTPAPKQGGDAKKTQQPQQTTPPPKPRQQTTPPAQPPQQTTPPAQPPQQTTPPAQPPQQTTPPAQPPPQTDAQTPPAGVKSGTTGP